MRRLIEVLAGTVVAAGIAWFLVCSSVADSLRAGTSPLAGLPTLASVQSDQQNESSSGSSLSDAADRLAANSYKEVAQRYLAEARRLAIQGDLAGARQLATRAAAFPVQWAPGELTPQEFLRQLDTGKLGGLFAATKEANETVADRASQSSSPSPRASGEDAKQRVADLIQRAYIAQRRGDLNEAVRLARLADEIARTNHVTFNPDEESPAAFLARLSQTANRSTDMITSQKQPSQPRLSSIYDRKAYAKKLLQEARQALQRGDFDTARAKAIAARQLDVTYGLFEDRPELVLEEIDRLSGGVRLAGVAPQETATPRPTPKQLATQLLQEAQKDLEAGRYAEARTKALKARELNVTYNLFELRPEHILAEVERRTGELLFARKTESGRIAPANTSTQSQASSQRPATRSIVPVEALASATQTRPTKPQESSDRIGAVATAQTNSPTRQTAQSPARGVGGNQPSIEPLVAQSKTIRQDPVVSQSPTEVRNQAASKSAAVVPAAQLGAAEQTRQQALALLREARQALQRGDLETARQKAEQAHSLKATYRLFDDRPELVLADVRRMEQRLQVAQRQTRQATTSSSAGLPALEKGRLRTQGTKQVSGLLSADAGSAQNEKNRQQALALLREAREALRAGSFDVARRKAEQAAQLKVAYQLFDDRPEAVLADIERLEKTQRHASDRLLAARTGTAASSAVAGALEPQGSLSESPRPSAATTGRSLAAAKPMPLEPQSMSSGGAGKESRAATASTAPTFEPEPRTASTGLSLKPEVAAVEPEGQSALELYEQGVLLLQQGKPDQAYHAFLKAYHSGQKLDPYRQQQLETYLTELAARQPSRQLAGDNPGIELPALATPNPGYEENPLQVATQQQALKFDRLRSEALNAIFRAERLKEQDPEQALHTLDEAIAAVEGSDLDKQTVAPLLASLQKTRASIQAFIQQRQPIVDLQKRNQEVEAAIRREQEHRVRVEQEFAKLVENFNELMKQNRFAEAEVVAKQAKELDPHNPVAETMKWKARFARRIAFNEDVKDRKEQGFWDQLASVEESGIPFDDRQPLRFASNWEELSKRRRSRYGIDAYIRTEEEKRIEESLNKPISLHFENAPLRDVIDYIRTVADINIALDTLGLQEEGVTSTTPVTIDVDGIRLKSCLNLMLEPLNLAYTIDDEVLKITSRMRQRGELVTRTYPVADLVIPVPNFSLPNGTLLGNPQMTGQAAAPYAYPGAAMSVPPYGGMQVANGQFQVNGTTAAPAMYNPWQPAGQPNAQLSGGGMAVDFDTLTDLIVSTIEPDSWEEVGGQGTIKPFESTLSLVIRQTQQVHDEIRDLLEQLRRLQDLQVTIEVRFITVSDQFFERIGVDFDFDLQDTIGGPDFSGGTTGGGAGGGGQAQGPGNPLPPFGSVIGGQQQQAGGGQQQQQGLWFTTPPTRELTDRDSYAKNTIIGLASPGQFTQDLDVAFRQGSFEIGVPDFGNYNPNAGLQMGLAILSDIETFFFIQAAQGDERSNIMFAPKVTLFNGQFATVTDTVARPFVTSLTPTVGAFSVGFTPQITLLTDGVFMSVQAVISADRRYVRLTVTPTFTTITDVQTFSFLSGGQGVGNVGGGLGGIGGGLGGRGGLGLGGFGRGLGGFGGGLGGFGGGLGLFSVPSGTIVQPVASGSPFILPRSRRPSTQAQFQVTGGGGTGGGGTGGGQQNQQAGTTVTVQQPIQEIVMVTTTVMVPDGGTVLLGGVKKLREGRNMAGVPILNKIPYISRLFKNTGIGRETASLMLMVTPRIVILEEEEELLGLGE